MQQRTFEDSTTGNARLILSCRNKGCKYVWAQEYMVVNGMHTYLRHDAEGNRIWVIEETCPECKEYGINWKEIVGKVTSHKCDAKCRMAKGPICECSCGGEGHARGLFSHD